MWAGFLRINCERGAITRNFDCTFDSLYLAAAAEYKKLGVASGGADDAFGRINGRCQIAARLKRPLSPPAMFTIFPPPFLDVEREGDITISYT